MADSSYAGTQTIEFQDANGELIQVKLPVKRMVVLTSDALEIVCALKAQDRVVGVFTGISRESLFSEKLKQKPKTGDWKQVNYELLIELKPDIVLCYGRFPGKNLEKKLNPFNTRVIRLDFFKFKTLDQEIQNLGLILEKQDQARVLIQWHKNQLDFLKSQLTMVQNPPDVYIEGASKYHTAGPGSAGDRICRLAGGNNIARNLSIPYPKISSEWVLQNNPDIIIKITSHGFYTSDEFQIIQKEIMDRPAWKYIKAVKNKRVHIIANEIWTGPRYVIGAAYMAKWFFPEKFKDFHPMKIHEEYAEKFHAMNLQGKYAR